MRPATLQPSGIERHFDEDEIIVSKTDLKGIITYANQVFLRVSGYAEHELLGQPHNVIRHPDMPRSVFQLLWDTLEARREIFAYVINMSKNGDHYWVFAHVTPTIGADGRVTGYHSNRRVPSPAAVAKVQGIYKALAAEESRHSDKRAGIAAALNLMKSVLAEKKMEYDEFVFSL